MNFSITGGTLRKLLLPAILVGSLFVPVTVASYPLAVLVWGLAIVLQLQSLNAKFEREKVRAKKETINEFGRD